MTPFSPVNPYPGSTHSSSTGSSETHPLALNNPTSTGSRRGSDVDYSRQTSEMSVASVEGSLHDPALLKSLTKFQRFVVFQTKTYLIVTVLSQMTPSNEVSLTHTLTGTHSHAHTHSLTHSLLSLSGTSSES